VSHVLVAGIGNIFFSDDGFGPAVAQALLADPPPGARVQDYGTRSVHLAYDLVGGPPHVLLVDAVDLDDEPGTIVLMAPQDAPTTGPIDGHGLPIEATLARARLLGATLDDVVLLGCVPATTGPGMALSDRVAAAVPVAVEHIRAMVGQRMSGAVWSTSSATGGTITGPPPAD